MARDRASRPEAKPQRLFVAVEVPRDVRQALVACVEPLKAQLPRARWVPPANQHLTLKFLGPTWPRLVGWVGEVVAAVAARHGAFDVALGGLGVFPNERKARVLWAGLDDAEGRLAAIAADLDDALASAFEAEQRDFTPHLTLARLDGRGPIDLSAAAPPPALVVPVRGLVLIRSHLRRPAPTYEHLLNVEMTGDA